MCEVQGVDGAAVARARSVMPPEPTVAVAAETCRVLGNPTRPQTAHAHALSAAELCVCDIATLLGMSQSVISHSLCALRQLRIVKYRKAGKIVYYSVHDARVGVSCRSVFRVARLCCASEARLIEGKLGDLPGVTALQFDVVGHRMVVAGAITSQA